MRCALMAFLVMMAAAPLRGEDWSGTFEVIETLTGIASSGEAKKEADATARILEERLARTREALKTAKPALAKTLKQDVAALEVELETLAIERGGTVIIGRTAYVIAATVVVSDGDDGRVVADHATGSAVVVTEGRRLTVAMVKPDQPTPPRDAQPGKAIAGIDTMRGTITVDGQTVTVSWAPGLPNVYALTRLSSHDEKGLHVQLATLPGLPMVVERPNPKGGTLRWSVQKLAPGPVDPRLLTP